MSATPDSPAPPPAEAESSPSPTGAYLGIAGLVLLGTALFVTAAVVKVRQPENAPPAKILGIAALQIATALLGAVPVITGVVGLMGLSDPLYAALRDQDFDAFARSLLVSRDWLRGKGGGTCDGYLCVEVTAPGRPYLYVNPEGGDYARYVARLG